MFLQQACVIVERHIYPVVEKNYEITDKNKSYFTDKYLQKGSHSKWKKSKRGSSLMVSSWAHLNPQGSSEVVLREMVEYKILH